MSLLHCDDEFVRGFPHAARVKRAASRLRQRGGLHAQHVNTRHIPDPASVLTDDEVEHLYRRALADSEHAAASSAKWTPARELLAILAMLALVVAWVRWS